MTFEEYSVNTRIKRQHFKQHKADYGMKQMARAVRRVIGKYDYLLIAKVIADLNRACVDALLDYGEVTFPHHMGKIEIRKKKIKTQFKDGKLITNRPVDWLSTLKLWYEDKEAEDNKIVVRRDMEYKYIMMYNRRSATFRNKALFTVSLIRSASKRMYERINDNDLDAFVK